MQNIKTLAIDFMNSWDSEEIHNLNENVTNFNKIEKLYESIFIRYSSYEDFIKQNLIQFNFTKSEQYIVDGKVNFYMLNKNIKSNYDLDNYNANGMINGNPAEHFKWKSYSSTLNFVNDLIFISEILKTCPNEKRNKVLNNFVNFINNTCLPSDIYIPVPFGPEGLNFFNLNNKDNSDQVILKISEDYAFCLSTKEKVPYHILIEIAEIQDKNEIYQNTNFDSNSEFVPNDISSIRSDSENSFKISTITKKKKQISGFFSSLFSCCSGEERFDIIEEKEEEHDIKEKDMSFSFYGNLSFQEVSKNLIEKSKYANKFINRKIISVIIKGGEDMRQDQFVSQVMEIFLSIFDKENLDIFLKPLSIITTGRGGIIQTLTNTIGLQKIKSIDFEKLGIKNSSTSSEFYNNNTENSPHSLKNYFIYKFGNNKEKYQKAVKNFMKSLVGYSLLCYFLEIKDRNNGNILIDDEGFMIHIDFGFLLKHSPGNMNFEKAPFKFTMEFLELLEGVESEYFREFQRLFYNGFVALRKNWNFIISFIEIYMMTNHDLPCFYDKDSISDELRLKFMCDLYCTTDENLKETLEGFTNGLIFTALDNWRTKLYDNFQKYCVGVN